MLLLTDMGIVPVGGGNVKHFVNSPGRAQTGAGLVRSLGILAAFALQMQLRYSLAGRGQPQFGSRAVYFYLAFQSRRPAGGNTYDTAITAFAKCVYQIIRSKSGGFLL